MVENGKEEEQGSSTGRAVPVPRKGCCGFKMPTRDGATEKGTFEQRPRGGRHVVTEEHSRRGMQVQSPKLA